MTHMEKVFKNYISALIGKEASLEYEWTDDTRIVFKKKQASGFDIILGYDRNTLYLFTDTGYHDDYDVGDTLETALGNVMGEVRDLLTSNMRIREFRSNGKPYRWILEHCIDGEWAAESGTSLLFWNYFGKQSERIYSNDTLPSRERMFGDE